MFSDFRIITIILVILAFFFLITFSFIKYNNVEETNKEHENIIKSAEEGERKLFGFLNSIQKIDWLNLEKKAIIEESSDEIEKENLIRKINLNKLRQNNFSLINWRSMWNNYWQEHLNWFNKELEKIKNN